MSRVFCLDCYSSNNAHGGAAPWGVLWLLLVRISFGGTCVYMSCVAYASPDSVYFAGMFLAEPLVGAQE